MHLRMVLATIAVTAFGCSTQNGPSPPFCGFTVKGASPVADGKSKVTIDAYLIDIKQEPVVGAAIQVKVTGTNNILSPAPLSDKTGHVLVTLASTVAETKTISVLVASDVDGKLTEVANEAMIAFVAGPPARLGFEKQPMTTTSGSPLQPVKVAIFDAFGNGLGTADPGTSVSLLLAGGSTGAVLGGTTTATSAVGEADFGDLTVNVAGTGYRLIALSTSADLAGVSEPFDIL